MRPNLPISKVKLVLVDKNISKYAKYTLKNLGIDYIETKEVPGIVDSTASHPDMQFLMLDDKNILVEHSLSTYYKSLFPEHNIVPINGISSPYPKDSVLNVTLLDDKCFLTEFQHNALSDYIYNKCIFINQGYSKCNICVLNENAVISSDRGIIKKAVIFGLKAYFLPDDEIKLSGYKNGFWGGATGLLDKDKLFFNGNIEKLSCYYELMDILEKEKIEPIYFKDEVLTDVGSIIPIF